VRTSTGQKKVYGKGGNSITSKLLRREFICKELVGVSEKLKHFFLFFRGIWDFSQQMFQNFSTFVPQFFCGTQVGKAHCLMLTHIAQKIFL
jgi:hypothetical protein